VYSRSISWFETVANRSYRSPYSRYFERVSSSHSSRLSRISSSSSSSNMDSGTRSRVKKL